MRIAATKNFVAFEKSLSDLHSTILISISSIGQHPRLALMIGNTSILKLGGR